MYQDVKANDLHIMSISQNKAGLKRGAIKMFDNGFIDSDDFKRINAIIDSANVEAFNPLIYLIPRNNVEKKIVLVDVDAAANPLSVEYQIFDLKREEFEVIDY